MSTERIKIPRSSDRTIAEFYKKLGARFGGQQSAHVSGLGFSAIGAVSLVDEPTGDWKLLLSHNSYLIDTMHLSVPGMSVVYARGGQNSPENKSPIFDEIVLNQNQQSPGLNADKLDAVALINKELRPFEPDRVLSGALTEEQSQLLAFHQSTLERLESLNEDLIRQGTEFRRRLEEQYDERAKANDEKLETERTAISAEFASHQSALESDRKALEEKLKDIDDRDNTHARREIRDKMLEDVKQRVNQFGVSVATEKKRGPVFLGICLLIATFAILLSWTAYEISSLDRQYFSMLETNRNMTSWGADKLKSSGISPEIIAKISATDVDRTHLYWLWVRFTAYSLGLLATILFYIKWQNKWAEQHSINEFQLRQFQIDISRANWVLESCLEWRKETESAIPSELLGSITRNLFSSASTEPDQVIHPADELASALLGSASNLKLRVGDNELNFDKPGKIPNKPKNVTSRKDGDA